MITPGTILLCASKAEDAKVLDIDDGQNARFVRDSADLNILMEQRTRAYHRPLVLWNLKQRRGIFTLNLHVWAHYSVGVNRNSTSGCLC